MFSKKIFLSTFLSAAILVGCGGASDPTAEAKDYLESLYKKNPAYGGDKVEILSLKEVSRDNNKIYYEVETNLGKITDVGLSYYKNSNKIVTKTRAFHSLGKPQYTIER